MGLWEADSKRDSHTGKVALVSNMWGREVQEAGREEGEVILSHMPQSTLIWPHRRSGAKVTCVSSLLLLKQITTNLVA